ncbi:MAG TPA: serine hydrolase domain-containing protein [Acidimicrobiales bacterium]|nr:serine hydrolase domain-containing protein [Acidimicrobiales bacterium]
MAREAVHGAVEPGYEPVRRAFEVNFAEEGEVGAAVAVYRHGRPVVDLWAGVRNTETGAPWEEHTPVRVASTTKGLTAVCANLLAQRGELDLDAPVAAYWPEFKAEGKESVPVRWVLAHRAGVPVVDRTFTAEDVFAWFPVVDAIAAQKPLWKPGTAHGYHGQTYGYMVGELVRRITGRTIGRFLAEEVAGPLALDAWIGTPEDVIPKVARVLSPAYGAVSGDAGCKRADAEREEPTGGGADDLAERFGLIMRVALFTHLMPDYNAPEWLRIEMPSANGVTTARSLAKLYASLIGEVHGRRLFTPETLAAATTPQAEGEDRILRHATRWGLGFSLASEPSPMLGPHSFGHAGAGGSFGLADPESGVSMGYVMNLHKMGEDRRGTRLMEAVRASL